MISKSALKKILFIIPYPIDVAPSQRFRFEQYFEVLTNSGYQYDVASFWSEKGWHILYQQKNVMRKAIAFFLGVIRRFLLLFQTNNYQFVFIHREALPLGPPIIEYVIAKLLKKKIIYDYDDAIWLPNTSDQNILVEKLKYHQKVKTICKWSWKVSCGNSFLADYARKNNNQVFVNPTTINETYHFPISKKVSNNPVTIGWTGSHSTTKYLNSLVPVFIELMKKHPLKIIIISNHEPLWEFSDYEFIKWNKKEEIAQLGKIDIGIMPLDDNIWEKGKCGFKALQYMAMGIPAIVSNVGANKTIIDHGVNGYLCDNKQDWEKYLSELIQSETLRKTIGKRGRIKVMDNYSVLSNTKLFLSLFE